MGRQFGALSGIAILLIVCNHAIGIALEYPINYGLSAVTGWQRYLLTSIQALGVFAVPTFLFISGSFISYAAQGSPPRLSRKFLLSSLRHIVFPYVIWSVIFYIFVYFVQNERYDLLGYLKNLIVGYPFHFVPLLVFFYLLSPLLIRVGRSVYGAILLLFIGAFQLLLLNILYPGVLYIVFPDWMGIFAPPVLRSTLALWAIFFPLGLVYGLDPRKFMPISRKLGWLFGLITAVLFIAGLLDIYSIIRFPLARFLVPVSFVLLLPGIRREEIPFLRLLERIGRRSYGIYLTHLFVLYLTADILVKFIPGVFSFHSLIALSLILMGCGIPVYIMENAARGSVKKMYRYVFG